jgi:hypothetical protein
MCPAPEVVLMSVYTLGVWTVTDGREEDFVRAWQELADRTKAEFPDETATLLRGATIPGGALKRQPAVVRTTRRRGA